MGGLSFSSCSYLLYLFDIFVVFNLYKLWVFINPNKLPFLT